MDSYTDIEQYEELLAFYRPGCKLRYWSMWRTYEDTIAVQPMKGSRKQFPSVSGALESLTKTKLPEVRRH